MTPAWCIFKAFCSNIILEVSNVTNGSPWNYCTHFKTKDFWLYAFAFVQGNLIISVVLLCFFSNYQINRTVIFDNIWIPVVQIIGFNLLYRFWKVGSCWLFQPKTSHAFYINMIFHLKPLLFFFYKLFVAKKNIVLWDHNIMFCFKGSL